MLQTTSSCAGCNSLARGGRKMIDMPTELQEEFAIIVQPSVNDAVPSQIVINKRGPATLSGSGAMSWEETPLRGYARRRGRRIQAALISDTGRLEKTSSTPNPPAVWPGVRVVNSAPRCTALQPHCR